MSSLASRFAFPGRRPLVASAPSRRSPRAAASASPAPAIRSPLAVEPLERRALLAVSAVLNGGDLEITFNTAGDLVADISSDGTNYTVSGTGLAATLFAISDVTGRIVVTDNADLAGQAFTVNPGTALANPLQVNANVEATTLTGGIITTVAGDVLIGSPAISLANDISTAATKSKVTFSGAVTLTNLTSISAGSGAVMLEGTVNGGHALTINSTGATTIKGAIGGVTPLASLTTNAGGTTTLAGRLVRTTGDQTYGDPLSLVTGGDIPPVTHELEGSTVRANSQLEALFQELVITGDAFFGGRVVTEGLRITGASEIATTLISAASLSSTTPGFLEFLGPVTLRSDVAVAGRAVRFGSTISGFDRSIQVSIKPFGDPVAVVFGGDVGTTVDPLDSVSVFGGMGDVVINGVINARDEVTIVAEVGVVDGGPNHEIVVPVGSVAILAGSGIGTTTPLAIQAATIQAVTTFGGDIRLRGIGDIVVGPQGIVAFNGGDIELESFGEIIVPAGVAIATDDTVTVDKPIRWQVDPNAGTGPGSLGSVINLANDTGAPGIIALGGGTVTYVLANPLPSITTSLIIDGGGTVTISGGGRMQHGFTFAEGSSGSELRGVALQGFRNFGIRLEDATSVTISDVSVTSMNLKTSMGLYATGDLTGTTIESSLFSGGVRGAFLVNARNLAFGAIGRGNTFANIRGVRGTLGTGIRSQGNLAGTVVAGNTFDQNNFGFAFVNARGLQLANNLFTRNRNAGIYIQGNNTGSLMVDNVFGTGASRNRRNIQRAYGARGL